MSDFSFKALGTQWQITIDGATLADADQCAIVAETAQFEKRFSRFIADSEVNAFRESSAGTYYISREYALLLQEAARLRTLTNGVYDPAAGGLLERAGYDATYRLEPADDVAQFVLPRWELAGQRLTIDGPAAFDLGGIGKGYWIDKVAALLTERGYTHIAVEAGGDMYVTTKAGGTPWKVAIEYPGRKDTAAGVLALRNQALAVSDTFRRRWGKWHHVVDPKQNRAVENIIGVAAIAPNAWHADCMTSALFLSQPDTYERIAQEYKAQYLVFYANGQCAVSADWAGELF